MQEMEMDLKIFYEKIQIRAPQYCYGYKKPNQENKKKI